MGSSVLALEWSFSIFSDFGRLDHLKTKCGPKFIKSECIRNRLESGSATLWAVIPRLPANLINISTVHIMSCFDCVLKRYGDSALNKNS